MKRRHQKKNTHRGSQASIDSVARVVIRPSTVFLDHEDQQILVFTADMLLNQLRRDSPKIEETFDNLCEADLLDLSNLMSKTSGLLGMGIKVASRHDQKLEKSCALLLLNASSSLVGAIALLRMGYVLQPGILIRSILEAVSTVLHLVQHPGDFKAFEMGKLQSTKTITAAKRAIPMFGNLYGRFSEDFVHISHLHQTVNPVSPYTERHEALEANLTFTRISSWLLYVTAELLFNELEPEPRYWKPEERGYVFNPSPEEREWMTTFFHAVDQA